MPNIFEVRFDPANAKEQIIYDEHIIRYELAKSFIKGKEVLDIACGTGYGSHILSKAGAKRVIGMDIDKKALRMARQKYLEENLEFKHGDAEKIGLEDDSADIITSFETIEHLDDPKQFLREIKRVLKDNGLLILSTPNREVSGQQNPYHVHEFEREELEKFLKHYFDHISVIEQHNALSSYLRSEHFENNQKYCRMLISNRSEPCYFIVLCSNSPVSLADTLPISSMNPLALEAIHNNPGWKFMNIVYGSVIDIPGAKWLMEKIKKTISR